MWFYPQTDFLETTCWEEVTIAFGFMYFDHQVSCKHNLFTPKSRSKQKIPQKNPEKINTTFKNIYAKEA